MRAFAIFILCSLITATSAVADDSATAVVTATNISAPPTLRCRPASLQVLTTCAIFLPIGEHLKPDKISADAVRWELVPEVSGPNDRAQSVVFVKAKTQDAGIATTVYLVTDAPEGIYRVLVVSDWHAAMFSEVHFTHAQSASDRVVTARQDEASRQQARANATAAAAAAARLSASKADLQAMLDAPCTTRAHATYQWNHASAIAPAAVFIDDLHHTCVQFDEALEVLPLPYLGDKLARFHPRYADHMLIIDGEQGAISLKHDGIVLQINYQHQ